jgi:hypothetical protein|tara:strand:- start:2584 stop:3039 length:456 start_codon:yes stop_codon:yes gene_type:complete
MKKIFLVIVVLFGCNKNVQKIPIPDNLISEEKMVEVIYEMTLISVSKGVNRRILENSGVIPEKYIFEKYNIDSLQFALSNEFYSNDLNMYLDIYNRVKVKLQENKQITIDSIENYKKNRAKRSLEIVNSERSNTIDSIKMKRSTMPLKTNN